jgi:hypothetical protein
LRAVVQPPPSGLADKEIWIIDDSLPVDQMDSDKDDLVQGIRPIDRGTLRALMKMQWAEIPVEDLCDELLSNALNVTGFIQPSSAVEYLLRGAPIPDAVIFDLKYRTADDEQVRTSLRSLLSSTISIVQVFTNDPIETAKIELEALLSEFPTRLVEPRSKADTTVEALSEAINQQVDKSLSAKLARELRRLSLHAVEDVLVKIDDLPDTTLLALLGGEEEAEEAELVELLSVKVTEALSSAPELLVAIRNYVSEKEIPDERRAEMVGNFADLVVANTQESIRNSGGLMKLAQNWESSRPERSGGTPDDAKSTRVVREFFQFRAYTTPPSTDFLVTTGDIVLISGKEGTEDYRASLPNLYLVITPPCDLAHFWKKTKGILTLVRMAPIDERGTEEVWKHAKKSFGIDSFPSSITARDPMLMPSVRLKDNRCSDYALFARDMLVEDLPLGDKNTKSDRRLSYKDVGDRFVRQCRVSQPFLGGILDEIRNVLFRSGIPDFPSQEKARMTQQFKDLKAKT